MEICYQNVCTNGTLLVFLRHFVKRFGIIVIFFVRMCFKDYCKYLSLSVGLTWLVSSCVNDDYDLNKDVDMTIGVGGDWVLPSSSTELISMERILDLSPDGIIQPNADGVYMLTKRTDEPTTFDVEVEDVDYDDTVIDTFDLYFEIPDRKVLLQMFGFSEQEAEAMADNLSLLPADFLDKVVITDPLPLEVVINTLDAQFKVPEEVVEVTHIGFSTMNPHFELTTTLSKGELIMHEVHADFPTEFEYVEKAGDKGFWQPLADTLGDWSRYILPNDILLHGGDAPEEVDLWFDGADINWTSAEGDSLDLIGDVRMGGWVNVKASVRDILDMSQSTAYLYVIVDMKTPEVGNVTVIVDPKIEPQTTEIELNDLPDFLTENDVTLILQNPMIKLNVEMTENTPFEVNCWGDLVTDKGIRIPISEAESTQLQFGGTHPGGWCIYDGSRPQLDARYEYYYAQGLSGIVERIPERINMNFEARVNREFYTVELGSTHRAVIDYAMECPLALGVGSQITFADTINDWHKDIEDYEVKTLKVSATLRNDTPLDRIDFHVSPIDADMNLIEGITVTPLLDVKHGDTFEIVLTCSERGLMRRLDGIILEATAKVTQEASKPLNAADCVQLSDVKVSIVGGAVIDLN